MLNITRLWAAALLLLLGVFAQAACADDNMFPPAPAAASSISFDGRGFLVHGKRTFILSGGMEYARIPHALWRDRLLRLKRAGFNCVEIYTFWNYHEPRPGQFDFTGDHDLDAFLKTVHSLGLYAIVRVGPYYCAEWDSGGYPVWLRFVPGVRVREDNPQFIAAVDRFWDHLMPIVAANQINHGGSVILVQLENEDPQGWGRVLPNSYFTHLQHKALSLGLQVPYFFSGLHHGSDPAGDAPWSSAGRQSPWMSTEFWSVWYDRYGQTQADADTYDRRMWKVLAYGGNGLNFYMFHGGTNFGYTNDDEDTASYDYGAAIGQAGDLRPTYYRFKRAALFAQSFASILEDSDNATDAYQSAATNPSVHVTARKSPAGTILFLDNSSANAVKTQVKEADGTLFPANGALTLAPGQIAPIVQDYPLVPGVTLERATPLLGIQHDGSTTTLVAYAAPSAPNAPPGDVAELRFRLTAPVTDNHGGTLNGNLLTVQEETTAGSTVQSSFKVGGQAIRILTMPTELADRTWFVDNNVIVEPDYVGDMATVNGKMRVVTESKAGTKPAGMAFVFGTDSKPETTLDTVAVSSTMPDAPSLSAWQTLPGDLQAAPSYSDAAWTASANPLAMGADGDDSAYAWYRATANVPKAGTYTLRFTDGGDWASVFVNGQHSASATVKEGVAVTLPAGPNQLAVLTAHYGRPKDYNYLGPIDTLEAKGLRGPVILDTGKEAKAPITAWRLEANADDAHAAPPANTTGAGWADGTAGPDIFHNRRGFAWYAATLPRLDGAHHRLHFENVDDNATVFLNGRQVATHQGWGQPFDAPLDTAWNAAGPNTLAVLVENTDGGGGIQGAVTLQTLSAGDEIAVTGWKMHGGIAEPTALTEWKAGAAASAQGSPAYYRAIFTAAPPAATGPHPILRVTTTGLSRGFVWLNGHNLGRYPEKIPVNGLYLPEPWLNTGGNELVIFDEEGHTPAAVALTVEQAASRFVVPMTEK
jgi:beta-galactosidase